MQEVQKMQVWSLGWEDPLEEELASHASILSWTIPWTEEPGGLYSPWVCRESDRTEHTHILYFISIFPVITFSQALQVIYTNDFNTGLTPPQLFSLSLPHPLSNYITSCSDILRGFLLTTEMKPHPLAGIQGPLCSDHATLFSHNALPILKWDSVSMWTTLTFTKDCQAAVGSVCCFNIFKAHLE